MKRDIVVDLPRDNAIATWKHHDGTWEIVNKDTGKRDREFERFANTVFGRRWAPPVTTGYIPDYDWAAAQDFAQVNNGQVLTEFVPEKVDRSVGVVY